MGVKELEFDSKVVLVTGGSRGLGKDIAISFARRGAKVIICGRKQENLDRAAGDFSKEGLKVVTINAHIAKPDQVSSMFAQIDKQFGRLDVLVNNVGMNILTASVADADVGLWDKIIEVNLKGTFLVSRSAVQLMRSSGGGKIVNISSIAARRAAPGMGIYCIAKAGVEMLTKVMAAELAKENINVNAVAPCMVKTQFSQPFWGNEELANEIIKTIPKGRIGETRDVVGAVMFLASELAEFVTGEVVTVDGGAMAI
ncbi:MAG: short-chain dehydrogenase [Deltaproteobacteria bacterium]|nr:MAG: short-chain dehydrogenase [Deltaproteobacteria bacterium]